MVAAVVRLSELERHKGAGQAAKLEELAERINEHHRAYETAVKAVLSQLSAAIDHAMDVGDLLIEAKAECAHGTWEDWLRANCKVSVRRAQEFVYLAERRSGI